MPARFALAALALVATPACSRAPTPPAASQFHFPALTGRVVDEADLLSPADEQAITAQSAAIERDKHAQYVVVTVPSLEERPIEDYTTRLGNVWGIGRKGANDGVILLLARNERKVRIAVGRGLENRMTDAFAAKVIRDQLVPAFKEGHFGSGISAGTDAIATRLRSKASDSDIAREDRSSS